MARSRRASPKSASSKAAKQKTRSKPSRATRKTVAKPARKPKAAKAPTKTTKPPTKTPTAAATKPRNLAPLVALGTGAFGGGLWAIIERVKWISGGDLSDACDAFELQLDALDDGALLATVKEFDEAMRRAYNYDLWGAAYLIHGGCGDDTFWDFRTGLVALGKEVYEKALADPDSLADVEDVENRTLFEGFQYIPSKIVERRGLSPPRGTHMPGKPTGKNWNDVSELEKRFPKLAARFN